MGFSELAACSSPRSVEALDFTQRYSSIAAASCFSTSMDRARPGWPPPVLWRLRDVDH